LKEIAVSAVSDTYKYTLTDEVFQLFLLSPYVLVTAHMYFVML